MWEKKRDKVQCSTFWTLGPNKVIIEWEQSNERWAISNQTSRGLRTADVDQVFWREGYVHVTNDTLSITGWREGAHVS